MFYYTRLKLQDLIVMRLAGLESRGGSLFRDCVCGEKGLDVFLMLCFFLRLFCLWLLDRGPCASQQ